MANMDILQDIRREQRHERAVKQFLSKANVAEEYMNYANFKLFADAKKMTEDIVKNLD